MGRLFHKTLPLKVNEFIPYFWVFKFGIEREYPTSVNMEYFSSYIFFTWNLWFKFIFRILYFNGSELYMPLISLQFIIQI